jgi:tripartite-type tricarboxylate transporter receptor subunit TctC
MKTTRQQKGLAPLGTLANFMRLMCIAAAVFTGQSAFAQEPATGMELVVPTAAEGSTDLLARLVAEGLTRRGFGEVRVRNMPGRSGTLAAQYVAAAAPDGRTFLVATPSSHGIASAFENQMRYDPVTSFTPILSFAAAPYLLVVKSGGMATLAQFAEQARAAQGQWRYSSTGTGGPHHLVAELYFRSAGLSLQHVPSAGGALALGKVNDDSVQVMLPAAILALPRVKQGTLKALAVTGPQRLQSLPDVPTFGELGTPVDVVSWYGLMGPAGLPGEQSQRLALAVQAILEAPSLQMKLRELGIEKTNVQGPAFAAQIAGEVTRWKALVNGLGLRASDLVTRP